MSPHGDGEGAAVGASAQELAIVSHASNRHLLPRLYHHLLRLHIFITSTRGHNAAYGRRFQMGRGPRTRLSGESDIGAWRYRTLGLVDERSEIAATLSLGNMQTWQGICTHWRSIFLFFYHLASDERDIMPCPSGKCRRIYL